MRSPSPSRCSPSACAAAWPRTPALWVHAAIAGVLSHAGYLGGSHYAQLWGLSAGVTALILALQPMLTALVMSRWLHERLTALQMLGVAVGLGGVALVVGHRVDGAALSWASLLAVAWALACVTGGTLYQRQFCATVDLRAAVCIHFAVSALRAAAARRGVRGLRHRLELADRRDPALSRRAGVDRRLHHPRTCCCAAARRPASPA